MRRARASLEEQVGGLLDHEDRSERRRAQAARSEAASDRYPLTARGTVAIRAARAVEEPDHRQVA